jgi:hypothetical protein
MSSYLNNVTVVVIVRYVMMSLLYEFEELDGPTVSALGVRSRKLSNVLNGQL